jgi:hypothetical protein
MNRQQRRAARSVLVRTELCLMCIVRRFVKDLASDPECPTDPQVLLGTGASLAGAVLSNHRYVPCRRCDRMLSITADEIRVSQGSGVGATPVPAPPGASSEMPDDAGCNPVRLHPDDD